MSGIAPTTSPHKGETFFSPMTSVACAQKFPLNGSDDHRIASHRVDACR